jgi:ferredoxin-NADP reductase
MTAVPDTASVPATGPWQAARVVGIRDETARAKTFALALERPTPHLAGQHFVLRLTAEDGYTASRSYSVASAPGDPSRIELTVELMDGGEVSAFMHDVVEVGDELEVRGPIGGWFVWRADTPAVLVGGGSGVVPLVSMLRLARATGASGLVSLIASFRTPDDVYYRDELPGPETTIVYTRRNPPGIGRAPGRLGVEDLAPALRPDAVAYVCGSSGFSDAASALLTGLGVGVDRIRVERFGPTA